MSDTGNVWTDERLDELKKLWAEGLSISQIGEALGVSRNAIAGKAHRMGLPKRPSPISKSKAEKPNVLLWKKNRICHCVLNCASLYGRAVNAVGQQVIQRRTVLFFVEIL